MGVSLPHVEVERIRLPTEHDAREELAWAEPAARAGYVPQDAAARRRALLGSGLLLTETMAPDAYDAGRAAAAALGVEDRIELFQSPTFGAGTVRLALYGQPIGVEFLGDYLDSLDRAGLLAVLGHEIGHALAHCGHAGFGWALSVSQAGTTPARRAYSMAAEFTADRFGLLACRDLEGVLRLEMQSSTGRFLRSIRFDTDAYLAQCRAVAEGALAGGEIAQGGTHPEHYIRGYAEWLFSESDLYKSITGLGPGSRPIEEVNEIVGRFVMRPRRRGRAGASTEPAAAPQAGADPTSTVRDGDRVSPAQTSSDLLTDGARRRLAAARGVVATLSRGPVPSLRRLADAALDQFAPKEEKPSLAGDDVDPLADDRRELIARFEELERRSKGE